MTRAYSEAAVEVLDILDHTDPQKVKLIPNKFISYLKENAANNYIANLDYSKPINELNIKTETKGILGVICRIWWWNAEQKQEYARLVRENEIKHQKELSEKNNFDDIFKKRNAERDVETIQQESVVDNMVAMETYREGFFKKFINKIKSFFH